MPAHETLLKQVEPLLVAAVRRPLLVGEDLSPEYERIAAYVERQGGACLHPNLLLWYSQFEMRDDGMRADIELAVPLRVGLSGNEEIGVRTLQGGLMACVVYPGYPVFLGQAFVALRRWLAENRYRMVGPPRQVHLQPAEHPDLARAVTELQFPVEKQKS
ncbi:MAG TPA: GyrI-like domain-containing protein, partial [Ktedonobacteraceae bacterium]